MMSAEHLSGTLVSQFRIAHYIKCVETGESENKMIFHFVISIRNIKSATLQQ